MPRVAPVRDLGGYAGIFARFPVALHRFLDQSLSLDEASHQIRCGIADREANLLRLARDSVFDNPGSPYLPLLDAAGCSFPDLEELVASKGVEGSLRELREAGVYVTYEEFKGRRPIDRAGRTYAVSAADFDNPRARRDLTMTTGGSTGQANLVYQDLDHIASLAVNELVGLEAHGVADAATIHWSHILPGSGIRFVLQRVRHGQSSQRWFTPTGWRDTAAWRKYGGATRYMLWWMRRFGVKVDDPRVVLPADALVVARAVRDELDTSGRCLLYASVSSGVRVALAAEAAGFDLEGATMRLISEPLTTARRERIEAVGARVLAGYGSIETGVIALGCGNPQHADDLHLLCDAFALIDHPHEVRGTETIVPAFNLTGLRETAPKVMLNYQIDDCGSVESRRCGCGLDAYGYDVHVHAIRSYTKLVGEGATLIRGDLLQLLEEALPRQFGGSPLDYQLQEHEDSSGLVRLVLVVNPSVPADGDAMLAFLIEQLRASSPMADAAAAVWEGAGTLTVARREPQLTARGKFTPLLRSGGRS